MIEYVNRISMVSLLPPVNQKGNHQDTPSMSAVYVKSCQNDPILPLHCGVKNLSIVPPNKNDGYTKCN